MGKNLSKISQMWHFHPAQRAFFFRKQCQRGAFLLFLRSDRLQTCSSRALFGDSSFLGSWNPYWSWLKAVRKLYWTSSVEFINRIAEKVDGEGLEYPPSSVEERFTGCPKCPYPTDVGSTSTTSYPWRWNCPLHPSFPYRVAGVAVESQQNCDRAAGMKQGEQVQVQFRVGKVWRVFTISRGYSDLECFGLWKLKYCYWVLRVPQSPDRKDHASI